MLYFAGRLTRLHLAVGAGRSKTVARQLFHCSILYLPLLFALMMGDAIR
jgi:heme O synthase-like polyprenyltransferase